MRTGSKPSPPPGSLTGSFRPAANSLNLVRLLLAGTVLLGHSLVLGGSGSDDIAGRTTFASVAVYGFFAISGFLLAGSVRRESARAYLRARFLRIFPGFWLVLILTACVIAPTALFGAGLFPGGTQYLTAAEGPIGYMGRNAALWIFQPTIAGQPDGVPLPGTWNGSLWTLSFEFTVYLLLLVMALAGALRRTRTVAVIAAVWWLAALAVTASPLSATVNQVAHPVLFPLLVLPPVFLAGVLLRLCVRIPDSALLAAGCVVAFVVLMLAPIGQPHPRFVLNGATLAAPLLAYPVMWAGIHLPFTRFGRRNDYSYGVYLYAFPIQQALSLTGLDDWGFLPYTLVTMVLTGLFALLSWHMVERPALRRKVVTVSPGSPEGQDDQFRRPAPQQ